MDILQSFMNIQGYAIIGLAVLVIILIILLMVAFKCINRLESRIRKLTRGTNNENIEEIINKYFTRIEKSEEIVQQFGEKCDLINSKLKNCIQKVAIKRYKAFEDVGSDLSFSIAALDENNSGFILTGIYGRQDSTVYAKPIDRGLSRYDLSNEEQDVLEDAMRN